MSIKRGATDLSGVLPVDKPSGMTSHDVVVAIRRAIGEGRVGHAGTLDPAATGLLIVLVGPCTRLEPYLSGEKKSYEARIAFGSETDTDDADGAVVHVADVPSEVFDTHHAQRILDDMLGDSLQTPPAYSAIKVAGRTAHRAARSGEALALEPRPVTITSAELRALDARARTWDVSFRVSKGTYIRAVARDIGRALGTAAHLAALRRSAAGMVDIADAHPLELILRAAAHARVAELFVDPVAALGLPVVQSAPGSIDAGGPIPNPSAVPTGARIAVTVDDRLAAVYRSAGDTLVAEVVLAGGVS